MKTVALEQYGGPELLKIQEVEIPAPKENEVLIKVHAASVNPLDWRIMRANPFFIRFMFGLWKPKLKRLGADVAGVIEAKGKSVSRFQIGDSVFGEIFGSGLGAFGEYVCVKEELLVRKPQGISFDEAASLPVAGLTALQGLNWFKDIQPGMKVLVNGASGGVGHFAVQVAKDMGAVVTGVCSTKNRDMVKSIGADQVIDYTQEDFRSSGEKYDLIYDAVANCSGAEYKRLLKSNGTAVVIGFTSASLMFKVQMSAIFSGKRQIKSMTAKMDQEDLSQLGQLVADKQIKPVIDKKYPLVEIQDAISYLETKRARGKVIINP